MIPKGTAMFATALKPANAYKTIGIETGIPSASPHKLILMLMDGALFAISDANRHMLENNIPAKGERISKAIDIISNGLDASLDKEAGGELALRLSSLYEYLCMRLLHANLKNDTAALKEVSTLLGEIKGAWEEIATDPAVVSPNRAAA